MSVFLKVDNVAEERMFSEKLFQATGPATLPGSHLNFEPCFTAFFPKCNNYSTAYKTGVSCRAYILGL